MNCTTQKNLLERLTNDLQICLGQKGLKCCFLCIFAVCRERSLLKSDGWESKGQTCEGNCYQKDEWKDKDFYAI